VRCTPVRYTPIRCTPVRYTLMRCTPVSYTPTRHMPVRCTPEKVLGSPTLQTVVRWSICRDLSCEIRVFCAKISASALTHTPTLDHLQPCQADKHCPQIVPQALPANIGHMESHQNASLKSTTNGNPTTIFVSCYGMHAPPP
jgi:hypothetical protein